MTKAETKSSILAQLNQQAVNMLVESLTDASVANDELKSRVAELEANLAASETKLADIAKPAQPTD